MRGSDLLDRRTLGFIGIAKIAMQEAADPMRVLHGDRPVETEFALDLRLLRRIDHAGGVEQDIGDVAGHQPQQHEDDHGDPE